MAGCRAMTVFRALEKRAATDGARPLLTWYRPADGARVEFSAISAANWVDKSINLLADLGWGSLAGDEDFTAWAPLLAVRPAHWVSLIWAMTLWQSGGRVVTDPAGAEAQVAILGPDAAGPVVGADTIACSLHPLGLGLATPITGVIDYREVLSQPDLHTPAQTDPDRDWIDGLGSLPHREPSATRVLLHPSLWIESLAALSAAVLGGGSVVLVDGAASEQQLATIAADEKAVRAGDGAPD